MASAAGSREVVVAQDLQGRSSPRPIAERQGRHLVVPSSLLSLTQFRQLNGYRLLWPGTSTKVQPGLRPFAPGDCYEKLERCWSRLEGAAVVNNRTRMFYAELEVHEQEVIDSPPKRDFVAVKEIVIREDSDRAKDIKAVEKAHDEFKHLSKIKHCHIIASLDMFYHTRHISNIEALQHHFVILLYPLAKRNLDQHLSILSGKLEKQGPHASLDPAEVRKLINYLPCLCKAVLYLHNFVDSEADQKKSPIRHRDIKPQNMLIDKSDEVFLADFDISKQYENRESAGTWGDTRRTVEYAAGVLLKDGQEIKRSFETDVISLGFVFLEILTVVLGASRRMMFRTFPSVRGADNSESFCHSKALELGTTDEWIEMLRRRIHEGMIPDRLKGNDVECMIKQIKLMMNAEYEAKGVLEHAYECFSAIADHCEHCGSANGDIRQPSKQVQSSDISTICDGSTNGTERETRLMIASPVSTSQNSAPWSDQDNAIPGAENSTTPLAADAADSPILLEHAIPPRRLSSSNHSNTNAGSASRDMSTFSVPVFLAQPPASKFGPAGNMLFIRKGRLERITYDQLHDKFADRIYEYIGPTYLRIHATAEKRTQEDFQHLYPHGVCIAAVVSCGTTVKVPDGKIVKLRKLFGVLFPFLLKKDIILFCVCEPVRRREILDLN